MAADDKSHASESDILSFELFRVVQELKYAEEFVGVLYIKPRIIIVNEQYHLTLGTRAPDPSHRWIVGTRPGGVKIGKIEAYCLSRDRRTAGQGP